MLPAFLLVWMAIVKLTSMTGIAIMLAIAPAAAKGTGAPARARTDIAGVYRAVDAVPVTPGDGPSESVMEIVPVDRDQVYVRARTTWANYHRCDMQAVFRVEPRALTYRGRTAAGDACGFDIERRSDRFVFRDPTGACLGSCGARGTFDGDDRFRPGQRRPIRYLDRLLGSREYAAAVAARDGRIPRPETYLLDPGMSGAPSR